MPKKRFIFLRNIVWVIMVLIIILLAQTTANPSKAQEGNIVIDFDGITDVPQELRTPIQTTVNQGSQYLPGTYTDFTVSSLRFSDSGVWAEIVLVPSYIVDAGWEVDFPPEEVVTLVAEYHVDGWNIYFESDPEFDSVSERIPQDFIDYSPVRVATANSSYLFPWTSGHNWRKTKGWHGGAIDFAPTVSDYSVLAPAFGRATQICNDTYQIVLQIQHVDGVTQYLHLASASVPDGLLGTNVSQGQYIGSLYDGTANVRGKCDPAKYPPLQYNTKCGCGTGAHLHFIPPGTHTNIDGHDINDVANSPKNTLFISTNVRTDGSGGGAPTQTTEWLFRNGPQGWVPSAGLSQATQYTEGMWYSVSGNDPRLTSPVIDVSAADYAHVVVKMASTADACGQVYFRREGQSGFTESQHVAFIPIPDGADHTYIIDMSSNSNWTGTIDQLRFDPACVPEHANDAVLIQDLFFATPRQEWSLTNGPQGWVESGGLSHATQYTEGMWYSVSGNDPRLISPMIHVSAADYSYFVFEMASTTDACGQVYFRREGQSGFTESQHVAFIPIPDGADHIYTIDMSSDSDWTGTIVQLRLDPACVPQQANDAVLIQHLYFATDKAEWNLANGPQDWQEEGGLTNAAQYTEGMWYSVSGSDPRLHSPMIHVSAADHPYFVFELASTTDACGLIYFRREDQISFSGSQVVSFTPIPDGADHIYVVDMSSNANWTGWISQVVLSPACTPQEPNDAVLVQHLYFATNKTEWNLANGPQDWAEENGLSNAAQYAEGMWYSVSGNDPRLRSPMIHVSAANYPYFMFEMASTADSCGQIYFRREGQFDFPESQSVAFTPIPDGADHTYLIPMDSNPNWVGTVIQLRLDPACVVQEPNDAVLIQYLTLTDATLFAPTGLSATASSTWIDLNWTDNSSDETAFKIERSANGLTGWSEIGSVASNQTTYRDTGTVCTGAPYYYRIRAFRSGDGRYSAYSNVADAAPTACQPLAAPSDLTAVSASQTQINLAWSDNSSDETDFHIEGSPDGMTNWIDIDSVPANTTTYQDAALTCGTTRYYRVRAHRSSDSQFSAYTFPLANTTTQSCVLNAPSALTAVAVSQTEIHLSWTDNSSEETHFYIERSIGDTNNWAEFDTVGSNSTTYQDLTATCDTVYYYRVQAYESDHDLLSPFSNVGTVTTWGCTPITKAILVAPATGTLTADNSPDFAWQTVAEADYYQIQIDDNANFANPEQDVEVTGLKYAAATLSDRTVYYWHVRGMSDQGEQGPWSDIWTVTMDTRRPPAPALKSPLDRTNTTNTMPAFSWSRPAGVTQFHLEVDDDPAFGSPVNIGTTLIATNIYTLPTFAALPYGVYYWHVQGGDAAGLWSDWSVVRKFAITLLKSPSNAAYITNAMPTFSWTKPTGALTFEFQLDNNADFSSPVLGPLNVGAVPSYTSSVSLGNGEYFWGVRVQTAAGWSGWMPAWTFTVTTPPTLKPVLNQPANGAILSDTTPDFHWGTVLEGYQYQIQIDNDSSFASPVQDVTLTPGVTGYTAAPPLPDGGKYFWRVRAINGVGVAGAWGGPFNFTLAQLAAPLLATPTNKTATLNPTPGFTWSGVTGAASYQIQISRDPNFVTVTHQGSPAANSYTVPGANALPDGVYTWRVRALDGAGVPGKWSTKWILTLDTTGPAAPVLNSPASNGGTPDTTPTFTWKAPKEGKTYHLQVTGENDPTFAGPFAINTPVTGTSFTPLTALSFGSYRWRVQAFDALNNEGAYSPARSFDITLHKSPLEGSSTTSPQPTFTWNGLTGAGSYDFELASDPTFGLPLVAQYSGPNKSFKPAVLPQGTYYWHVRANTTGWMPTWTVIITPPLPARPVLAAPANKALLKDNTPTLNWNAALNASTYQVQIDNNSDFSSPAQDVTVGGGLLNYIAGELADGTYSWRVRAVNSLGAPGAWSAVWSLSIDTAAPAAPVLIAPLDGGSVTNTKLNLTWTKITEAARYELQLDPDPAFSLPVIDAGSKTSYKPPTPLSRATYSWQVRSVDKAGNVSAWSETRSFELVAGITAQLTPTPGPTLVPTLEPTVTPLPTETPLPPVVNPPVEGLYTVESEDPAVIQTGAWTAHETPYASGGRYLFSGGSPDDTLSLTFSGSRLDVIYVKHPALGVFVIEIDGVPVQLVDSTAPDSEFGARATVSLGAGSHTLRVYPMTGTMALDAFAVETQTPPQPTVEPTGATLEPPINPTETVLPPVEPTAEPTGEPTFEPTAEATLPPVEPTAEPPLPPVPTNTPLPGVLPFADSFDSGQGWNAAGAWRLDTGHSGLGWFADSTPRDQVSTLTYGTLIDLRGAAYPQVSFWQKAVLTGGESLAVEVSLDGGLSWLVVDQQTGLISDWTLHTVDLSAYRGSIIGLRFTLNTFGSVPEGVSTVGCWLDDLAIQDAPPISTATPLPTEVPSATPLPTEVPTEIPTATEIPTEVPTIMPVPTDVPAATPLPTEIPLEIPTDTSPVAETPAS